MRHPPSSPEQPWAVAVAPVAVVIRWQALPNPNCTSSASVVTTNLLHQLLKTCAVDTVTTNLLHHSTRARYLTFANNNLTGPHPLMHFPPTHRNILSLAAQPALPRTTETPTSPSPCIFHATQTPSYLHGTTTIVGLHPHDSSLHSHAPPVPSSCFGRDTRHESPAPFTSHNSFTDLPHQTATKQPRFSPLVA